MSTPGRSGDIESLDADVPKQPSALWSTHGLVVLAVAAGGVAGALARYAGGQLWPTRPGTFPATTLLINVLGCALMGVLLVLISDVWSAHRLIRTFLGTGVLGGFTTFSTYSVDTERLFQTGHPGRALAYAGLTVLAALWAVAGAAILTRWAVGVRWKEPR